MGRVFTAKGTNVLALQFSQQHCISIIPLCLLKLRAHNLVAAFVIIKSKKSTVYET